MDCRITSLRGLFCALAVIILVFASVVQSIHRTEKQHALEALQPLVLDSSPDGSARSPSRPWKTPSSPESPDCFPLCDLRAALATMQDQYFDIGNGKWTTSIDWTAAVMNTHLAGVLSSLSSSISDTTSRLADYFNNEISKYFAQSTAFYYGENAFEIRMQAYDDMLWVVLEWLESIKFIEAHSTEHYANAVKENSDWYGWQFVPAFAHRARVFYELAEQGWDWKLCGGGMTWNPRLLPYKNAITNQLFITASINMYLHFPGDENDSPFISSEDEAGDSLEKRENCDEDRTGGRRNPIYRESAINGYKWLKSSGMLNDQGLYTDGFHIRGYPGDKTATTCNEQNEMVYTYNQGVILSGLRGLWEATSDITYLDDANRLIENVIRATGWDADRQSAVDDQEHGKWSGLGSRGILTELCDPSASCNQDAQAFKGIFFHHLTSFCEPLSPTAATSGKTYHAPTWLVQRHNDHCDEYAPWVVHNARAALATRDHEGRFGSWWGSSHESQKDSRSFSEENPPDVSLPAGALDYRNFPAVYTSRMTGHNYLSASGEEMMRGEWVYPKANPAASGDLNDRGRGRTLETQGGGVAVVRAMSEFLRRREQRA